MREGQRERGERNRVGELVRVRVSQRQRLSVHGCDGEKNGEGER